MNANGWQKIQKWVHVDMREQVKFGGVGADGNALEAGMDVYGQALLPFHLGVIHNQLLRAM